MYELIRKEYETMARSLKKHATFSLSPENYEWLQHLSEGSGISMSLFIDSLLTGSRSSLKDGVSKGEAMSLAFEQIAKGIKRRL